MIRTILSASVLALLASAATAEVTSVADRMAVENAPQGYRAGSFLVIPKVDVDAKYNDNIYATSNNEESDFIGTIRPEVAVKSNWNRHSIGAVANVEANRFMDNDSEDTVNALVGVDGRLDVMRDTSIGGGISFARNHEDRGDPSSLGAGKEPTQFNVMTGKVGAYRTLGRANARLESEAKSFDYKNGTTAANAVINNNLRDRNQYAQSLRLGYQFTPAVEAYVKGIMDNRVYDIKTPTNRTNRGQTLVAGAVAELTGKTKADVFAGVEDRNYTNSALKDISEPTFGAAVTWNATDLTTVLANVTRSIEETTVGASSGFVSTNYGVGVQHALTRRWLLQGDAGMTNNEYQGLAANQREDDIVSAGVGAKYFINRCLSFGPEYRYTDRDSSAAGGDFSRNSLMMRLTATY